MSRFNLGRGLSLLLAVTLTLVFIVYVVYQGRFLIKGPQLELTTNLPSELAKRRITLTGWAQNITAITLNGRPIVTTEAGYFEEPVILENGYNVVTVAAEDRYGRNTRLQRTFVYNPQTLTPQ